VKTPWNPELVNTLHQINLTRVDEDGSVRMDFIKKEYGKTYFQQYKAPSRKGALLFLV
jgi:hypothetical protein